MFDELFQQILAAEEVELAANRELKKVTLQLQVNADTAALGTKALWEKFAEAMQAAKVDKVRLRGEHADYLIAYSKPREVVEVADIDALPEQFIRIKKEPDKIKLAEFLKQCHESNNPLPNYATLRPGKSTLGWKPIKKETRL